MQKKAHTIYLDSPDFQTSWETNTPKISAKQNIDNYFGDNKTVRKDTIKNAFGEVTAVLYTVSSKNEQLGTLAVITNEQ